MNEALKKMVESSEDILDEFKFFLKNNLPKGKADKYDLFIASSVIKAIRTYKSILSLAKIGEDEGIFILLRSLFECIIKAYWILFKSSKKSHRMTLYKEDGIIREYELINKIENIQKEHPKEFKKLITKYKRILKKYGVKTTSKLKYHPEFPTIRDLTEENYIIDGRKQNFEAYYSKGAFYGYLCSYSHNGSFTKDTSFQRSKKGIEIRFDGNYENIHIPLHEATGFMFLLINLFNKIYDTDLKDIEKKYGNLEKLYQEAKRVQKVKVRCSDSRNSL